VDSFLCASHLVCKERRRRAQQERGAGLAATLAATQLHVSARVVGGGGDIVCARLGVMVRGLMVVLVAGWLVGWLY
jgi:hypothetical protein